MRRHGSTCMCNEIGAVSTGNWSWLRVHSRVFCSTGESTTAVIVVEEIHFTVTGNYDDSFHYAFTGDYPRKTLCFQAVRSCVSK